MKKRIGIIGGGQLGLMIAQEAHHFDAFVTVLDPSADAPAFAEADARVVGAFDDLKALERLCEGSDVVTYEFENVPGDILRHLEGKYNIKQGIAPLFDSQDRLREKDNARAHGLMTPEYFALPVRTESASAAAEEEIHEGTVETSGKKSRAGKAEKSKTAETVPEIGTVVVPMTEDEAAAMTPQERLVQLAAAVGRMGKPCVLKTRRLGYDGHGQAVIRSFKDIEKAAELLSVPCILEEMIDFDFEASVVMVSDGSDIIHFPVARNIHRDGILDLSIVPTSGLQRNGRENETCRRMTSACESFMKGCGYKGILAIELFVKGDDFYFNEMAPRPHNSGHYTIEGCTTSQYRELCHFLLDMPLTVPELIAPTVMKNILGQDLDAAKLIVAESLRGAGPGIEVSSPEDVDNAFCGEAGRGVYVHLYGKTQSRPKRKMGHITFVPMTLDSYYADWAYRFV